MEKIETNIIDVQQLKAKMDKDRFLCLIDVRELDEWQEGHIPSAIHIPKNEVAMVVPERFPDKDLAIYLHCKGGVRSLHAADSLIAAGYKNVYSVAGGIMAWANQGYPVQ